MEEEITRKPYVVSTKFNESRADIYEYSLDTFGYFQAERYFVHSYNFLNCLCITGFHVSKQFSVNIVELSFRS